MDLACDWLSAHGVTSAEDGEELANDVALRFLSRWDQTRSPAAAFLFGVLLPAERADYFRRKGSACRESALSVEEPDSAFAAKEEEQTVEGTTGLDFMQAVLKGRSAFLSPSDKDVVRCRLDHPEWNARNVARVSGIGEASVSLLLKKKLPLELMARWIRTADTCFDSQLPALVTRVENWHRQGETTLAAVGADLLLSGFYGKHRKAGLTLTDERGSPLLLRLLTARVQSALAEQELAYADRVLGWMDRALHEPALDGASVWRHAFHCLDGRRLTAAFRYGEALAAYKRSFAEIPRHIWERDGLFLHSVAVAHRGTANFAAAQSFIDRSLDAYGAAGRSVDVAHTLSRKARIAIEHGETEQRASALDGAEEQFFLLTSQHPRFALESPLGHVQNRLHRLRYSAIVGSKGDVLAQQVYELSVLVDRGSYAHEFLELEEVCTRYDFAARIPGLVLRYSPSRPRFGRRPMEKLRRILYGG